MACSELRISTGNGFGNEIHSPTIARRQEPWLILPLPRPARPANSGAR
jgi:hypothetical protein